MALILNLETATKACSVALAKDGEVIAFKEVTEERYSHSEQLTLFIEEVMQQAGVAMKELQAVAVSAGPGSYTGLRIGTSTAKGFCYALEIPLIAVDTLTALAVQGKMKWEGDQALFIPMLDARRMEVYDRVFDHDLNALTAVRPTLLEEKPYTLHANQTLVYFGDGSEKAVELMTEYPNTHHIAGLQASARSMAPLSEQAFAREDFADVAYFEPFYLKEFVAGIPKKMI